MAIVNNLIMQVDGNNYVVYPYTVGRAVYINESNGYNLIQALEDLRNNAVAEWINIRNKPFTTLSNSFKVVGGQLQLNGSFSTEWNDIQNKPSVFNTSWSRVSGKPESYPSSWDDLSNKPSSFVSDWNSVQNKPNYFPAEWNNIANKPNDFNAEWNDVRNKPNYYPTNWELVENKPEQLASTWNDISNKPFETLDRNLLFNNNNQLTLINIFQVVDNETYPYEELHNANNYYVVYNFNEKSRYADYAHDSYVLPQFDTLKSLVYTNYEGIVNFEGVVIPVTYLMKYNDLNKALTVPIDGGDYYTNPYCNADAYYLNQNISNTFKNLTINGYNFFNMQEVVDGRHGFENVFFINNSGYGDGNSFHQFAFPNLLYSDYMFYNASFAGNSAGSTQVSFVLYGNNINYDNKYMFDNLHLIADNYARIQFYFREPINSIVDQIYQANFSLNNVKNIRYLEISTSDNIANAVTNGSYYFNVYLNNCIINQLEFNYNRVRFICPNTRINSLNIRGGLNISQNSYNLQQLTINNVTTSISGVNLSSNENNQSYLSLDFNDQYSAWVGKINAENILYIDGRAVNSNVQFENSFQNCILNVYSVNTFLQYLSNSNITLYYTFNNTRLDNMAASVTSQFFTRPYRNIYHAFDNCHFVKFAYFSDNVISATGAFSNCMNLTNASLQAGEKLYSADYIYANCPNITNITGGGTYSEYFKVYFNNLNSISHAFYNSDLKNDVEFNLFVIQNCDASDLFGGNYSNAYTKEKRIHIFKDSAIDKASLTNPYFIENNASLNAENITILDNGRYFGDYHLYIYNDIQSPVYFFNNIYGTMPNDATNWETLRNILITDVVYTNQLINPLDSNLWALGPWDQQQNSLLTMAYLNNVSNVIYLSQNSQVNNCAPAFFNEWNIKINTLNIQKTNFLYDLNLFKLENSSNINLYNFAYNSKLTQPLNLKKVFDKWNLNFNNITDINAYYMYSYSNVTSAAAAFNGKMNQMAYMFFNCPNLVTQYTGDLNLAEGVGGVNFAYAFANCFNLTEPLIPTDFNYSNNYADNYYSMYQNCYNLVNGYIGPRFGAYSASYTFDNCNNLQSVLIDIEDERSMIYNNGAFSYVSFSNMFGNCRKLQKFRIKTKNETYTHPSIINSPINFFTDYSMFSNCKSLVYQPILGFAGGIKTNYGSFRESDNIVVTQDDNSFYWDKENNYCYGIGGYMTNYINGGYYSINSTNNTVIVGIGNGLYVQSDFCNNMPNLMMASATEYIVNSTNSQFSPSYGSFSNCNNLLYGRFLQINNYLGFGYNYNQCPNLLLFETSETALRDMINLSRGGTDNRSSGSLQITYSYDNCFNLIEARMPFISNNIFKNIAYSFNNCFNLRYAQIAVNYVYYAFINCYNLRHLYHGVTNQVYLNNNRFEIAAMVYSSFNNCYNLTNSFVNNFLFSQVQYSFCNCYNIKGVFDLNCVRHMVQGSFHNVGISSLIVPPTLSVLQDSFRDCNNLTSISITRDNNGLYLSSDFYNCPNLTDFTFEGTNIENYAESMSLGAMYCYNCPNLRNVTFVNYINVYGGGSYNSVGIENITLIGDVVTGNSAFQCYQNLKNIIGDIHTNNSQFESMFSSCSSLTTPFNNILVDVTNMYCMYSNCTNLLHSARYNNVVNMAYAYNNCSNITDVYIGPTVVHMRSAYENCRNIPSNISIESLSASWEPVFEWRMGYDLDIHISPDSTLYTNLAGGHCHYTNILFNAPEESSDYTDGYGHLDAANSRFYWLQPNIHLNVYYDLITE